MNGFRQSASNSTRIGRFFKRTFLLGLMAVALLTAQPSSEPETTQAEPARLAFTTHRMVLPTSLTRATFGNLGIQRVEAANVFPYTAIVQLYVEYRDGHRSGGSGAVVDRFHVLTAGHVIYDRHHGGFASKVEVYAGRTGSAFPFGGVRATNLHTFQGFINDDHASPDGTHPAGNGDIALVVLDQPLGDRTGWFAFGHQNDDRFFAGQYMQTAGFPAVGGPDGTQMYYQQGQILGASPGTSAAFGILQWRQSSIRSVPGQSGSPLWFHDQASGKFIIYGVLDVGNDQEGFAERITPTVFNQLRAWGAGR